MSVTNSPAHDDWLELATLYGIDALDDLERARFERHLDTCPECQEEVRTMHEVGASLAALTAEDPPAGLRDSVLGIPRTTPQVATPAPAAPPAARRRQGPATVGRRPWWTAAVAAAAALVVVVTGVGWWNAENRADDLAQDVAVLGAPDARPVLLSGPAGDLRVVASAQAGVAVVRGAGLADPDGDTVYQLWRIDPAGPVSLGLLGSGADISERVRLDRALGAGDVLAVTVEPAGGSPAPTGDPVLVSDPLT
jgi:anti-sigma-K factor RskA